MSTTKKLRGGSNTAMTQLKQIWRELPETERERWEEMFVSNQPIAEIRQKMKEEMEVYPTSDKQWCRFRDWVDQERAEEDLKELVEEDERYYEQQFGRKDTAMEMARQKLMRCSYAQAIRVGNYQDGLRTLRGDCRERRLDLAAQNSAESHKEGQARALGMCLDDAKKFPEVVEQFRQVFTALGKAREEQV